MVRAECARDLRTERCGICDLSARCKLSAALLCPSPKPAVRMRILVSFFSGRRAHAPTIDVLDGCVNNAIGLFAELAMSEDGHRQTKPNEEAQDAFSHDEVPASQVEGAFVPDVAKVEEEDVYVDIEEASASRFLKIPALGWFVFLV